MKSLWRSQNILPASVLAIATALVGYNASSASEITSSSVSSRPETILYTYLEKDVVTEKASDVGHTPSYQTVATLASATTQNVGFEVDTPQSDYVENGSATFTDQVIEKPTSAETTNISFRRDKELVHEVQPGQTLSAIAQHYDLKLSTVMWENGLHEESVVHPGDKLTILPINGVRHKLEGKDTVDSLAKLYQVKKEVIAAFNNLEGDHLPGAGVYVTIPGGIHPNPAKPPVQEQPVDSPIRVALASEAETISEAPTTIRRGGSHVFPWGWCTYWAAKMRGGVTFGGNAKNWPANARAHGYVTGKTPRVGSTYVEPWLTRYGHVSHVVAVHPNGSFTVSEMNYRGWGKVSTRTVGAGAGGTFIY